MLYNQKRQSSSNYEYGVGITEVYLERSEIRFEMKEQCEEKRH